MTFATFAFGLACFSFGFALCNWMHIRAIPRPKPLPPSTMSMIDRDIARQAAELRIKERIAREIELGLPPWGEK